MIRKIVQSKDPILRIKSKPVKKIDKKVLEVIRDLEDTLNIQKDPEGVGLAAPQIGKNVQIFIANYKKLNRIVINPKILEVTGNVRLSTSSSKNQSKKTKVQDKEILEGCLSLPHYYGPLKRSETVKLEYLNQNGEKITEVFYGFNAQIMLHEIDHLNGILFIDRLLESGGQLFKVEGEKWEEVELT